MVHIG